MRVPARQPPRSGVAGASLCVTAFALLGAAPGCGQPVTGDQCREMQLHIAGIIVADLIKDPKAAGLSDEAKKDAAKAAADEVKSKATATDCNGVKKAGYDCVMAAKSQ